MEAMRPPSLQQLHGQLIQLGFARLEVGQQMQRVPQGPGYHDAMEVLRARQQQVNDQYAAVQKEIKQRRLGVQPSLF